MGFENVNSINVAQKKFQWWDSVNRQWDFGLDKGRTIYWRVEQLAVTQQHSVLYGIGSLAA